MKSHLLPTRTNPISIWGHHKESNPSKWEAFPKVHSVQEKRMDSKKKKKVSAHSLSQWRS